MEIKRKLGTTAAGRPVSWYVDQQVARGTWREEVIPADVVGLSRPLTVFRAPRKTKLVTHAWYGDRHTFCPPMWYDLAIGSGPCGLGCRPCFLMLTHRIRRDPLRHLLYDNLEDFTRAVARWLRAPARRRQHTLGVGMDRSDSLLYEGLMPHVRSLAPLFADPGHNPNDNRLILLTKTANTFFLADVSPAHRSHVVVSFSLNPEPIADLWEGVWPGTGQRITPPISKRLEAARHAQELGFEVRARVDPILMPDGWQDQYRAFVADVKAAGIAFRRWTLGTYRQKNAQLDAWRARWGLPPMGWQPDESELVKEGTHWHLPAGRRMKVYTTVRDLIEGEFPAARVSLCKETHRVRRAAALANAHCNCL